MLAIAFAACGDDGRDTTSGGASGPKIVATTTQVADFARQVAGDRAQVSQILRPNADPHDYEPKPSDARNVTEADLVLRSGGDLDEWLDDVLTSAGSDAQTVTLIDAVRGREGSEHGHEDERAGEHAKEEEQADEEEEHADEVDPHWWQDPGNAALAVTEIRDTMIGADPDGRQTYTRNAAAYVKRIRSLDAAISTCMKAVPATKRKVITDHDALGYFADHYGIEVVGTVIPALSTQAEASAGEVADLVRTIRREQVRTIFPESAGNTNLQKAIADEAGAKVGPGLYADTLGPPGSTGQTYLDSLRANAEAILASFTGTGTRCPGLS